MLVLSNYIVNHIVYMYGGRESPTREAEMPREFQKGPNSGSLNFCNGPDPLSAFFKGARVGQVKPDK